MYQDKIDFSSFVKDLIHSDPTLLQCRRYVINCLFHGTRQSNYNVGPIFIMDLWHFFHFKEISWLMSQKKSKIWFGNRNRFYFEVFCTKVALPLELKKFLKPCDITESELNTIFMAQPKNSSIFLHSVLMD